MKPSIRLRDRQVKVTHKKESRTHHFVTHQPNSFIEVILSKNIPLIPNEHFLPIKTDASRGSAGQEGREIFNSDDGTNWTLPDGTTT